METTEIWEDDDEDLSHSSLQHGWDLEDALAQAILGDLGERVSTAECPRQDVEEERLIERLHSLMFPPPKHQARRTSQPTAPRNTKHAATKAPTTREPTASKSAPRRSMSPVKVDQMLSRFKADEVKRQRDLTVMQLAASDVSIPSSSASRSVVKISPHSKNVTRQLPSFADRQAAIERQRAHAETQRQSQVERREHEAIQTVATSVRNPCICGAGSHGTHTQPCERFLATCSKMKKTPSSNHRRQSMRRSIDDMMRFGEDKKRKEAAIRAILQQREQQEMPFSPRINQNSVKIYRKLLNSGKLHERTAIHDLEPARPSQPVLPRKSVVVLQKRSQPLLHRRTSISSRTSTASAGRRSISARGPSRLPQAASFSESHWFQRAASPARPDPARPLAEPAFTAPWTVVEFDPAVASFILEKFELPVCL